MTPAERRRARNREAQREIRADPLVWPLTKERQRQRRRAKKAGIILPDWRTRRFRAARRENAEAAD